MSELNFETFTASGRIIDTSTFSVDDVDIDDIAHSLAHINRYHGTISPSFNVADHSRLVADAVRRECERQAFDAEETRQNMLGALLHDAHEYLIGDVVSPVKRTLGPEFENLELRIDRVIAPAFGLHHGYMRSAIVKRADAMAGHCEAYFFVHPDAHPAFEKWGFNADEAWRAIVAKTMPDPRDYISAHAAEAEYEFRHMVNTLRSPMREPV